MNTLTLQLGHSELIYLLWLMKTLALPGIESKSLGDQSNEQLISDLTHAKQSLQARGLIGLEETDVKINQHAVILVGTCALSKTSLMLESQSKDATAKYLSYYFCCEAWVRHSILETGAHNFSLVESPLPDFANLIADALLKDIRVTHTEFTLPKVVVDQVLALFSYKPLPEASHVFQGAGLPIDFARVLVDTLGDLQQKICVGVTFHNRPQEPEGESVLLIRNMQGFWHVDRLGGNGLVKLTAVSQQEVVDLFNHIVQQAKVP
jgi:hypothetical protein